MKIPRDLMAAADSAFLDQMAAGVRDFIDEFQIPNETVHLVAETMLRQAWALPADIDLAERFKFIFACWLEGSNAP